jgi:DNA-directed RNA polymerase specialized sigma24 family protein
MDHALRLGSALADHEARFEQLFAEYHGDIHAYLCRLVGDQKQAEDLAQDVFVKT